MAETCRMERLGGLDLQVLLWDDFGWSGDIGALAILDGAGLLDDEGDVRIEASVAGSRRDCTLCLASGSACTGRDEGWAGRCGSIRHPSTSPSTSGSTRSPLRLTRRSYCWRTRSWRGDGWTRHGRCGRCGCCPACRRGAWACS